MLNLLYFFHILALGQVFADASNASNTGIIPCESIPPPSIPGAEVVEFVAKTRHNVTGLVVREEIPKIDVITGLDFCNVNISLSHRGGDDRIGFEFWLPLSGWNGRLQGVGGGGWVAGHHGTHGLGIAVEQGFAAGVTNGGNISNADGFVHDDILSDGVVDFGRLSDFAHRGIHEISVLGKAITESYYGKPPHHAYWVGCSTGGRQGHMLAQRFPDAFDGILANAPAVSWPTLMLAIGWGEFVMRWKDRRPSACVFEGFRKAAVEACDELDGVADGVITDVDVCDFDPFSQVGEEIRCDNATHVIATEDAEVLRLIHDGPRSPEGTQLWKAFPWGIGYTGVILVEPSAAKLWNDWYRLFIKKDRDWDISTMTTLEELTDMYATAHSEYGGVIGTDIPDLTSFRDRGGKLLSWHGTADDMIPLENSVHYRRSTESVMGGNAAVNEFYRFFVAPGVAHCLLGPGAYPKDSLESLIAWVERGKAPRELHGTMKLPNGNTAERKLCPWPKLARFNGKSDSTDVHSFSCS
ncbi:feruloyl esterase B [Plectosphaerella plurivora]|uniref:Carboxylic ester hydrolase n=1 Tax=Plectosphaerella plurivora TaxID=936078 RepID=A0A9P8UV55_9PEZI|nr:feruloyl esterase B [Plectosphaerella plurivora]